MTRTMRIVLIMLPVIGLGAVLTLSFRHLWSSYVQTRQAPKPTAPPAILLQPSPSAAEEAAARAAVAKGPTDAVALTKLGDVYMAKKQFATAIDLYKKAVAADPAHAVAWSALGEAYAQSIPSTKTQLPPEAHDAFMKAIAIDSADLRSRFYLAMEKDFLGHHDDAMNDWITMLQWVPMGSQADNAIRATIVASMGRSATIIRYRVNEATKVQPKPGAIPAPATIH